MPVLCNIGCWQLLLRETKEVRILTVEVPLIECRGRFLCTANHYKSVFPEKTFAFCSVCITFALVKRMKGLRCFPLCDKYG